ELAQDRTPHRPIRSEFVTIVTTSVIKGLLDDLWQQHVFNTEETEYMKEGFRIRADMARCLIDMVIRKGERASHIMIDGMKKRDHHLCSTLGLISSPAGVGELLPLMYFLNKRSVPALF
uniref:CARD domain-containing protein n=1 Tax=Gadus morhua TaxID=8049 RepID=A0A8C5C4M8_GADMO